MWKENGAVVAIHIYLENGHKPMAELVFAYGGSEVIEWGNIGDRQKYKAGINAYTIYFDERAKWRSFDSYIKPKRNET